MRMFFQGTGIFLPCLRSQNLLCLFSKRGGVSYIRNKHFMRVYRCLVLLLVFPSMVLTTVTIPEIHKWPSNYYRFCMGYTNLGAGYTREECAQLCLEDDVCRSVGEYVHSANNAPGSCMLCKGTGHYNTNSNSGWQTFLLPPTCDHESNSYSSNCWCGVGVYGDVGGTCAPCEAGKFAGYAQATACLNCVDALGAHWTSDIGAGSEDDCFLSCPSGFGEEYTVDYDISDTSLMTAIPLPSTINMGTSQSTFQVVISPDCTKMFQYRSGAQYVVDLTTNTISNGLSSFSDSFTGADWVSNTLLFYVTYSQYWLWKVELVGSTWTRTNDVRIVDKDGTSRTNRLRGLRVSPDKTYMFISYSYGIVQCDATGNNPFFRFGDGVSYTSDNDGVGTNAQFRYPIMDFAFKSDGLSVFVGSENYASPTGSQIRKIDLVTDTVTKISTSATRMWGMTIANDQYLFLASRSDYEIEVLHVSDTDVVTVYSAQGAGAPSWTDGNDFSMYNQHMAPEFCRSSSIPDSYGYIAMQDYPGSSLARAIYKWKFKLDAQCVQLPGCGPGQVFDDDQVCVDCSANTYQDESSYTGECKHCLEHSNNELFVHEGTEFPNDRVGLFTSTQAGSSTCGDCVAHAEVSSETCKCSAGYYRAYTLFNTLDLDRCDACPINTYKSTVGVVAGCQSDNTWSDGTDTCADYEAAILAYNDDWCGFGDSYLHCCICSNQYDVASGGSWGDGNPETMRWVQSQCTACPDNSYASTTANVDATACKCNAGYTGPDGGPCVACEVGTYKTESGDAACTACAANSVSPAASTTEDACICDTGYELATNTELISSWTMMSGTYCNRNTAVNNFGSHGNYANALAACKQHCLNNLEAPYYSYFNEQCTGISVRADRYDMCWMCRVDEGIWAPIYGSSSNWDAYTLTQETVTTSGCQACEAGKYKFDMGDLDCTACPDNSVDVNGEYCICNAGYYLSAPDTCLQCAVGTWKSGFGNATEGCTNCGDHMTTYDTGSTEIQSCKCNAGYYGDYEECQVCAPGSYSDTIGNTICTDCPVGRSSLTNTNDAESDCVADTGYEKINGVYTECQIRFYKNTIGNTPCIECLSGSTTEGTGSTQNTQCECISPNYYGTPGDECLCAGGYARWHDHDHATMRRLLSHEDCNLCEEGKYCPAETDSMHVQLLNSHTVPTCPVNSYSPAGSSSTTDCVCNAGYTGPNGGACTACAAATYKDAVGSAECTSCANFETSPEASASLTACVCEAGYAYAGAYVYTELTSSRCFGEEEISGYKYYQTNLDQCRIDCDSHPECVQFLVQRLDENEDPLVSCTLCDGNGHVFTDPVLSIFTRTESDDGICEACSSGRYKISSGDAGCSGSCPDHSTSPVASDELADCSCNAGYAYNLPFTYTFNGYYWICPEGEVYQTIVNTDSTQCEILCSADPQCTQYMGGQNCELCNGNTQIQDFTKDVGLWYKNYGTPTCDACGAGKYKDAIGDAECTNCAQHETSPQGSVSADACVCVAGYAFETNTCSICAEGKYKITDADTACDDCPAHATSSAGSDELTDCFCNAGYSGSNGGVCTICPTDTYQDTPGSSTCETCPGNSQSPQGSVVGDACLCNAGYEEFALDVCSACPNGKFKTSASHDLCETCPSGSSTANTESESIDDCVCMPGFYADYDGGSLHGCESCAVGTYKEALENAACENCPSGSSTANNESASIGDCVCMPGFYVDYDGGSLHGCESCAVGTYKEALENAACENCPSGSSTANNESASIDDCVCMPGFYADYDGESLHGCESCVANTYKEVLANTACEHCGANMNSPTASTTSNACLCNAGFSRGLAESGSSTPPCQQCEQHTYCPPENTVTATSVNVCPNNANSPAGSDELTDCKCNMGYSGPDGGVCLMCDDNYYKDTVGSLTCSPCPEFSTTTSQASTSIDTCICDDLYKRSGSGESTVCHRECGPGFEASDDESRCVGCRVSHYKPDYGDHDCSKCPGVSYSLVQNQTALNSCICPQGYVWNGTWCHQCAADTFNNRANQTACFNCTTSCDTYSASRRLLEISTQAYTYRGCFGQASIEMVLTDKTEERGVRCCSTDGTPLRSNRRTCNSYCVDRYVGETFDEAVQMCKNVAIDFDADVRICSRAQLDTGECCATGCSFDDYLGILTWVLDPVDGTTSLEDTWAQLLNPPDPPAPADHTTCPGLCVAPAGYRVNADGNNVELCPVNYYQNGSAANCTKCPSPETYSSEGGLTSVTDCECRPGYTRVGGTEGTCDACETGTYKEESGDGPCISCGANANTAGDASDSVLDCLCQPGYTQSGDQCVACVGRGTKHILSNVSCIQCPEHSTLHQDKQHDIDHCQCDHGYSGLGGNIPCIACAVGKFSLHTNNAMLCHDCPVHATTESTASKNESFCVCETLYEPSDLGGPWDGYDCISSCGAGYTGSGNACEKCAVGSFKSQRGGESCTLCTGVRSNSRPGSISSTNCSCVQGKFGVDSSKFVVINSVGGWSENGVKFISDFTQASSTFSQFTYNLSDGEAYRSVFLKPGGLDLDVLDWQITVQIDNLLLFFCTFKDCPEEKEVLLSGLKGVLKVSGYVKENGNLKLYTRKTLTLQSNYTFWNDQLQAQAENLVARKRNRAGDYLFTSQNVISDSECINCPPKLNCKEFI